MGFLKKYVEKVLTFTLRSDIIKPSKGGEKVIEFITSMANLASSLLALITAIIAYKVATHNDRGDD